MRTTRTATPGLLPRLLLTGALGAVLVTGTAAPAHALDVPPRPPEGAVQDQADLLSTQQEAELNRLIGEKNRDNEYIRAAVLTVNDTQGESIEDFSREVATDWGVGEDGRNNGVLVVADMGERKLRVEVADGAREVLSDDDAQDIMHDELEPGFKDERYAEAFSDTLTEVYDQANPQAAADRAAAQRTMAWVIGSLVALGAAVAALLGWRHTRRRKRLREQADREIEQFQREHPDEEVTEGMRRAYYRYREQNPTAPGVNDAPRKGKDKDGIEHEIQYAPSFQSWLPLYVMYPSVYSGVSHSSSSSSSYGGGAGTSFGGGGGFSGGGASGSF
ncbi:YgcG family protein [Kocuria sp.]|uniref:TPM domain-containing protein n=1 Tax=Kocuria sp. TaxID=1871328 RepID=UPI0026DBD88D|nr:TPM domain-containing protein [Kocuria sp.]MDO4917972.1 TPM domain-containing protein [Kocuria sp.]